MSRRLTVYTDDDGMVVIRGRLAPDVGAVVRRALDAAHERLREDARQAASGGVATDDVDWSQRHADALGLLAEVALASDLDAGSTGDRYQVVVHVDGGSASDVGVAAAPAVHAAAATEPTGHDVVGMDGACSRSATPRCTFPRNPPCSVAAPRRPETQVGYEWP